MNKEQNQSIEQLNSFKEALNLASMVIILDKKRIITEVNELLCNTLEYKSHELIGKNISILRSGKHSNEFYVEMWQSLDNKKNWRGEILNISKTGKLIWVDNSSSPITNNSGEIIGYLMIRNEITPKKELEQKLISQNNELSLLTNSSPIFILKLNRNYQITYINRTGPETSVSEVLGMSIFDLVINREKDKMKNFIDAVFTTGNNVQFEMIALNKIKEPWWIRANVAPIKNEKGEIDHVIFLTENINELKKTQKKLNESFLEYKMLIENSPLQIVKLNRNHEIVFISKAFSNVKEKSVLGLNFANLVLPEYKKLGLETLEAVFNKNEQRNIILKGKRFDGIERWFQINVGPVINEKNIADFAILNVQDITETVLQKEALEKAEKELTSLLEYSPLLIVTLNKKYEVLYTNNELLNSQVSQKKINATDFVHPNFRDYSKELINSVFETGKQTAGNLKGFYFDNTKEVWMRVYFGPIKNNEGVIDSIILNIQNISRLVETTNQLKQSEANFKSLADNIPVNIIKINNNFIVDYVNKPSTTFNLNVHINKSILDTVPDSEKEFIKNEIEIVFKTGEQRYYERQHFVNQKQKYWISVLIGPVYDANGQITGAIKAIRDITYRINDEQEKEILISDLLHKNNDLNQFTYIISHNLRAPISNILGLCSIIADDININKEEATEISKLINISAKNLDRIIKDLSIALTSSSNISHAKQEVYFLEILEQALRLLKPEIEESKINIYWNIQKNAQTLITNKVFMDSIFYNLISNAIKYRNVKTKSEINISISKAENNILIHISDNGLGIDLKKYKDDIFKFYKRFHSHVDGKGMGLFMVKSQILSMGGTIDLESTVNKGTRFILSFPD